MNISFNETIIPTPGPSIKYIDGGLFIIIAFMFFSILTCGLVKILMNTCESNTQPQVAILVEIPIAVSISTQTVDNEHIGTVI